MIEPEAMRSAVLQRLVGEMQTSYERLQQQVTTASEPSDKMITELETLIKEARRQPKKGNRNRNVR